MVDYSKLAFDSSLRIEHIALKGSSSFTLTNSVGLVIVTIPHNLGYSPYFKMFYGFGDGKYFGGFAGPASFDIDSNQVQIDNMYADTVNLYVQVSLNFWTVDIHGIIYYRIYAEPQS